MAAKEKEKTKEKAKESRPAVVRAQPLAPASLWEREFERFFDDFRHLTWPRFWRPERWPFQRGAIHAPAIDVVDEKDEVVVKAELPGLAKDDVRVELTDSTLIIKGEKRREKEVKEENYYRSEREYGSIHRSVELPVAVKTENVKATFKDGVLEVRLPKTEEAKRKPVKVQVQ
jgi:HSP20 family protein